MLGAPPAVGHIDDGDVEGAEDAEDGGQGLHLRAGGETAEEQVADVDEPENEGGGEAGVPGPPDAPGATAPDGSGDEDDSAEDYADFGSGQGPGVRDLRVSGTVAAEGQRKPMEPAREMAKKRKATMAEGTW